MGLNLQSLQRPVYDNCAVADLRGEVMFRCSLERLEWYLERGLAKVIKEENPRTIQLLFETKGPGNKGDQFYLEERINRCVVCAREDSLTRHHVVPLCYRKHMPTEVRDHSSHDIVPVCHECHEAYERHSARLTMKLRADLRISHEGEGAYQTDKMMQKMIGYANTLLKMEGVAQFPIARAQEMRRQIAAFVGKDDVAQSDLESLAATEKSAYQKLRPDYVPLHKKLLDAHGDLQGFVVMWRNHFVEIMQPKYLPPYWSTERSAER